MLRLQYWNTCKEVCISFISSARFNFAKSDWSTAIIRRPILRPTSQLNSDWYQVTSKSSRRTEYPTSLFVSCQPWGTRWSRAVWWGSWRLASGRRCSAPWMSSGSLARRCPAKTCSSTSSSGTTWSSTSTGTPRRCSLQVVVVVNDWHVLPWCPLVFT